MAENKTYLCPRGTVVNGTPKNSGGLYEIDGLEKLKGDYPLIIRGINFNKQDILLTVACLNNVKVIYSFGQDFGNVAISGEILLGPIVGSKVSPNLKALENWFSSNRSSKKKKPVLASIIGGNSFAFYLQSLRVGDPNYDFHVQPFVLTGVLVENFQST